MRVPKKKAVFVWLYLKNTNGKGGVAVDFTDSFIYNTYMYELKFLRLVESLVFNTSKDKDGRVVQDT